jgi:hypothetical protein
MQLAADRATDVAVRRSALRAAHGPALSWEHAAAAQILLADPERDIRQLAADLLLGTNSMSDDGRELLLRDYLGNLRAADSLQRIEGLHGLVALASYGMEDAKVRGHATKMLDDLDPVVRGQAVWAIRHLDKERQREP